MKAGYPACLYNSGGGGMAAMFSLVSDDASMDELRAFAMAFPVKEIDQ